MKSLACQIKDEVDALIDSGAFEVVHMEYRLPVDGGLECGCALGVVSKLAAPDGCAGGREGAIEAIHTRWPEIPTEDLRQMEMAFEGWSRYMDAQNPLHFVKADPSNEFYKLGKHIASRASKRRPRVVWMRDHWGATLS